MVSHFIEAKGGWEGHFIEAGSWGGGVYGIGDVARPWVDMGGKNLLRQIYRGFQGW